MAYALLIILLIVILPIALIAMIITAIVKHNKNTDTKSSTVKFEKSIRSIYVYIVLIGLLCTIIAGTIYLFNSTLDLVLPEQKEDTHNVQYYDTTYSPSKNNSNRDRNENIVGIFTSSAMLVSCIPLFVYYNKVSKKDN